MEELNFNHGAYLVFYCYVKQQAEKDKLQNNLLDRCIKELESDFFKDHVKVYMEIVLSLPSISIEKLDECNNEAVNLNKLESITAEDFDKSVKRLIEKDCFASLDDLVICLQLIFNLVSGGDDLVDYIFNIVLDPLKLFCDKLLHGDYDWLHLRSCPISDTDLSSSIVMVPEQVTISATTSTENPRSGLQLSSFTSIHQDEGSESMDSATPPEIIEKPPNISASFVKLMNDDDVDTSMIITKEDTPSIDEPITSSEDSSESVVTVKDETSTCQEPVVENEEPFLKTYLPHISIGVFAAAACIGIMTLKK